MCPDDFEVVLCEGWENLSNTTEVQQLLSRKGWKLVLIDLSEDISSQLECAEMLWWGNPRYGADLNGVVHHQGSFEPSQLAAIDAFVSNGGGLLVGGLGRS